MSMSDLAAGGWVHPNAGGRMSHQVDTFDERAVWTRCGGYFPRSIFGPDAYRPVRPDDVRLCQRCSRKS